MNLHELPGPAPVQSAALPGARRSGIAEYVRTHQVASVAELADSFAVSTDTIRRDLDLLDEQGLVRRTHGGAVAVATPAADLGSIAERGTRQLAAKRAIGSAAARLVRDGETVLINGGTTTVAVARALVGSRNIALITCSPAVAQEVGESAGRGIFLLGGRFHPALGVVIGPVRLPGASGLRADLLITGAAGVSADGISIANIEEAEMLSGMIESAERIVVVADSTKFDRTAFARLAGLDRVNVLVTDRPPGQALGQALEAAGVELVIA